MPVPDSAVGGGRDDRAEGQTDSYRRLADVFHLLLSEQTIDALLERVADALAEIVPHDSLTIYQADVPARLLIPVLARDKWSTQILNSHAKFGRGLTGWAVENRQAILSNQAHLDPRAENIPGTPVEPEALISIPLIARDVVKGALNVYRVGEGASFSEDEFELAQRFADLAALGLDNAHTRAGLELQAQTDSLTGLYNHRHFHERLRAELTRVSRTHDAVSLMMLDLDDFKRINDVHGHSEGDGVLVTLAEILKDAVRASDLVCRIGGDEFAVVMPSCDAGDALGLARRLAAKVAEAYLSPSSDLTLSVGIAQAPEHATNSRELVACAEAAMMAAKARGKDRVVLYDDDTTDRPEPSSTRRDVRSIAHMKMLQSLAGKLNRLSEMREIGSLVANELRTLIDYHNCRVYVTEGEDLVPVAFRGELSYEDETAEILSVKVGEGITGRVAETGRALLLENARDCEYAITIPGTEDIDESVAAVPLVYGAQVIGVIFISKLGVGQFDNDDVRLLEVLAGHAAVALENARLYDMQRKEAENAKALLDFADRASQAQSVNALADEAVKTTAVLLDADQVALWMQSDTSGDFQCIAQTGYIGDSSLEQVVRQPIPRDKGDELLGDRRVPFVVSPMSERLYFSTPGGTVSRSLAIVPLAPAEKLRAWMVVRQPKGAGARFTDEKLRLLAGISYQTSVAMQKAGLYEAQRESAEIASSLLEFSRELAAAEGLDEVLARIVELSGRILGSPQASVWIEELETGDVLCEAMWGYSEWEGRKMASFRCPRELGASLFDRTEPYVLKDSEKPGAEMPFAGNDGLMFAIAPLNLDGGRLGSLVVTAPALGGYEFSDRKMRLLAGIAHQAKLAVTNAGSFENLERTFLSTVEALVNALEAKDEYTSSHARNITDMCLRIGEGMGMGTRELRRLELGALFHDIGKIGIPSKILGKPGPLTPAEREIIETHPEVGERILAPIDRLDEVRPIVRHCHEHFDGGGYPDGKAADEIPIESRIILVCDAFHAMTTDRPYRARLTVAEACDRLRGAAGKQFDPVIVTTFLELLEETDRDITQTV